jgi:hypothetical protein
MAAVTCGVILQHPRNYNLGNIAMNRLINDHAGQGILDHR